MALLLMTHAMKTHADDMQVAFSGLCCRLVEQRRDYDHITCEESEQHVLLQMLVQKLRHFGPSSRSLLLPRPWSI